MERRVVRLWRRVSVMEEGRVRVLILGVRWGSGRMEVMRAAMRFALGELV